MRLSCFLSRNLGPSWLVFAVLVNFAAARTPRRCADTCTPNCGSSGPGGTTCQVTVSRANGPNGHLVANGQPDPVCVAPKTKIMWSSLESSSEFTIRFGRVHPFPTATHGKFKGKPGQPAGDEADLPSSTRTACFQYSVKHCINGQCVKSDPKVIVTNVVEDNQGP
jgi:hypothetical protein